MKASLVFAKGACGDAGTSRKREKNVMFAEKYLLIRIAEPHPTGYLMPVGMTRTRMDGRFLSGQSVPLARSGTIPCDNHVGEVSMGRRSRKRVYCYGRGTQIRLMLEPALNSGDLALTCFSRASDCLERLLTQPCDVLIVELGDSDADGLDLLAQTHQTAPWISTLAVVGNGAVAAAVKAIKAGACECLEKPLSADRFNEALEELLERVASLPRAHRALTQMEIQILQLILAGKTSQHIATHLHRSKRTIDVHRKNIMRKVQATSLADLFRRALSMGLAEEPGCEPAPERDDP